MRMAYVDSTGLISEILPEEFQTIEMVEQYYSPAFASHCQLVPDDAQVGMGFYDGKWQFPPVDPPHEVTMGELVNRVIVVESDVDEVKRGLMDVSMRIPE